MQTSIIRLFLLPRAQKISEYDTRSEAIQQRVLRRLVAHSERTEWGMKYGYASINTYDDFARQVPLSDYENLKEYIDRMRHGEKDILWPGQVKWFAKSSGTTNDKSKFIPVSAEGLHDTHYQGGTDCVAVYLQRYPDSSLFDSAGKGLILGGSHAPNYNLPQSLVGDLSAILIENINPAVSLLRVPDKETALISDFEEKMDRIAQSVKDVNVTSLSGVPSWMMAVLKHTLSVSGKQNLCELWPNLEVFFHGGVAFTPYVEQYKKLIPNDQMRYEETYNASEGFFGIQDDPSDPALKLMVDYGIFYEFIPMSEFGKEHPTIVPLWGVETGVNYAMVISTSCGLWRYILGDTVRFTQKDPYKFFITGRTKHFINAFGEELIVDNAEKGLKQACAATGAHVHEYTAAPVFMDGNAKCRHQWVVEFDAAPSDVTLFAELLDRALREINSDYEAKRYKDITLQPLEVVVARKGLFHDWLKEKGKLGGQHKVPRLSNSRQYVDELIAMNK